MLRQEGWEDLSRIIQVYEKLEKTVDADLVLQYIQHPKIARDFAAYYDLYQKYQSDYQIEAILRGENFDRMQAKVAHASFDERMSVVHLLLSGVQKVIRRSMERELVTEKVFAVLKDLKQIWMKQKKRQRRWNASPPWWKQRGKRKSSRSFWNTGKSGC